MKGLVSKVTKKVDGQKEAALTFFRVLVALDGMKLPPIQIALLAHVARWKTISTPPARESFILENKSSKRSLYNTTSLLQKKGLLVKDNKGKIRLHPDLRADFDKKNYKLEINIAINGNEG